MIFKIAFIADLFETSGFGHFYRLKSLYDYFSNNHQTLFFLKTEPKEKVNVELFNQSNLLEKLQLFKPNFAVMDGYSLTPELREKVRNLGCKTIFVADFAQGIYPDDVVINHAMNLNLENCQPQRNTKFFQGADFALVRNEFLEYAKKNKAMPVKSFETAFVSFGGADPFQLLPKYCNWLASIAEIKSIVALGRPGDHFTQEAISKTAFYQNLSASELVELLTKVDFGVVPASTLSYELCCMRIPFISGFFIENQKLIYNGLSQNNCALGIENLNKINLTYSIFEQLKKASKSIVESQIHFFKGNSLDNIKNVIIA